MPEVCCLQTFERFSLPSPFTYTTDEFKLCAPRNVDPVQTLVDSVINEDVKYSKIPLDLRYQRTFAVKVIPYQLVRVGHWWADRHGHSLVWTVFWMSRGLLLRRTRTMQSLMCQLWEVRIVMNVHFGDWCALKAEHGIKLELKYDNLRQFYIRLSQSDLQGRDPPDEFVNVIFRKGKFECSTLTLMKRNQKVSTLCQPFMSIDLTWP